MKKLLLSILVCSSFLPAALVAEPCIKCNEFEAIGSHSHADFRLKDNLQGMLAFISMSLQCKHKNQLCAKCIAESLNTAQCPMCLAPWSPGPATREKQLLNAPRKPRNSLSAEDAREVARRLFSTPTKRD